jgi:Skp family chaperone for outer membrane proteins
LIKYSDGR